MNKIVLLALVTLIPLGCKSYNPKSRLKAPDSAVSRDVYNDSDEVIERQQLQIHGTFVTQGLRGVMRNFIGEVYADDIEPAQLSAYVQLFGEYEVMKSTSAGEAVKALRALHVKWCRDIEVPGRGVYAQGRTAVSNTRDPNDPYPHGDLTIDLTLPWQQNVQTKEDLYSNYGCANYLISMRGLLHGFTPARRSGRHRIPSLYELVSEDNSGVVVTHDDVMRFLAIQLAKADFRYIDDDVTPQHLKILKHLAYILENVPELESPYSMINLKAYNEAGTRTIEEEMEIVWNLVRPESSSQRIWSSGAQAAYFAMAQVIRHMAAAHRSEFDTVYYADDPNDPQRPNFDFNAFNPNQPPWLSGYPMGDGNFANFQQWTQGWMQQNMNFNNPWYGSDQWAGNNPWMNPQFANNQYGQPKYPNNPWGPSIPWGQFYLASHHSMAHQGWPLTLETIRAWNETLAKANDFLDARHLPVPLRFPRPVSTSLSQISKYLQNFELNYVNYKERGYERRYVDMFGNVQAANKNGEFINQRNIFYRGPGSGGANYNPNRTENF